MKITHWAKFYPPEWGGIESVTRELAIGSARAGHEVSVVAFSKQRGHAVTDGVTVHRYRALLAPASQPLSLFYLWRAWREARRSDVVHIHYPNLLVAVPLALLGRGPLLVLHWHSDVLNKGLLGKLVGPIETWLARRVDRIIATSPPYAATSPVLSRFKQKVSIVPLGISDPAAVEPQGTLPEDITAFLGNRKLILAVGRLVYYKGFHRLLDAAGLTTSDSVVIVVGTGPLEDVLREQIGRDGLEGRVLLPGRLDDRTLRLLFKRASIFAMTSIDRAEAFGVVLLEAMAHGLPVILTDISGSGAPWVAPDKIVGLTVRSNDVGGLAGAINALISDSPRRRSYGRAARERFESMFTADNMVRDTLTVYGPEQS